MNVRLGVLGLALPLAFSACSSSNNTALTPQPPGPAAWSLIAGASSNQQALQGLSFYPAALTANAGDTLTWTFPTGEPHTVTLLGPGGTLPSPGDPNNPKPAGGATYDGSRYTSSGFVLLGGKYSLTFPKGGTYRYYCLIHPGMAGTVTVNGRGTAYPTTQAAYAAQGSTAQAADLQAAAASVGTFPYPAGGTHLAAGISPAPGPGGRPASSTVLRFLSGPTLAQQTVTIPVGTTLTWTNLSNNEPHTVTLGVVGQPFPSIAPPGAPTGNATYDGTTVSNSGIIFPGGSYNLTFTRAGTYVVHCLYHDDTENMISTVIVQ